MAICRRIAGETRLHCFEGSLPPSLTLRRFARPDGTPGADSAPSGDGAFCGAGRQAVALLQHIHRISFLLPSRFWKHSSFFLVPASDVVLHELVRRLGHAAPESYCLCFASPATPKKPPQRPLLRLSARPRTWSKGSNHETFFFFANTVTLAAISGKDNVSWLVRRQVGESQSPR